jgi:hypothetical protein
MNTVISRTDSFETWRRGTNLISSTVGDINLISSSFQRRKIVLKDNSVSFSVGDKIVGTIPKVGNSVTEGTVQSVISEENTLIVDSFINGEFIDTNRSKLLIILESDTLSGTDFQAGDIVTGLSSDATGKVFSYDNTDFPRLILYNVSGNFLEEEILSTDPDSAGAGDAYGTIETITDTYIDKGERILNSNDPSKSVEIVFSTKDLVTAINEIQNIENQFQDLQFTNDLNGNKIIFGSSYLVIKFSTNPSGVVSVSDTVKQKINQIDGVDIVVSGVVSTVDGINNLITLSNVVEYEGQTFQLEETDGYPSPLLDNDLVDLGLEIVEIYYGTDDPHLEWNNNSETLFVYSDNSGAAKLNVDSVYANNYYGIDTTEYFVAPSTLKDIDTTSDEFSVYVKGDIATDGNKIVLDFNGTRGLIEWDGSDFSFDGSTISALAGASSMSDLTDVGYDSAGELQNNDILVYSSGTSLWEPSQLSISQLSDVSTVGVSDGQVLKWSVSNSRWQPASDLTAAGSGIALTDLSVTDNNSPTLLSYNNTSGVFTLAAIDLNNLNDVNAGSPSNGQILTWDSGTSKWIASSPAGGGNVSNSGSGLAGNFALFTTDTTITEGSLSQTGLEVFVADNLNVTGDTSINGALYFLQGQSGVDVAFTKESGSNTIRFGEVSGGVAGQGFFYDIDNSNFTVWGNGSFGTGVSGVKGILVNDWYYATSSSDLTAASIYRSGYSGNATTFYQEGDVLVRGVLYLNNGYVDYSDENLKDNILTLEDSLVKVKQLRGVSFNWKSDESKKTKIGLVAQEVQKVVPEVVEESRDGNLGVNYSALIAHLIEAIKTQDKRIEELERKLDLYK